MANLLASQTGLGESGEILLGALQDAKIHLLLPARHDPQPIDIPLASMPAMAMAVAGRTGLIHARDYRGVEVLAAYRPVGYQDWGLVVKLDVAEAYAPLARFRVLVTILEGAIFVTGVISSYLLARRFTQPIPHPAHQAGTIATGGLTARIRPAHQTDEFGDVAWAFYGMACQLCRPVH